MTEQGKVKRKPTLAESLMAVLFLIIIIVVGNVFFGLSVELMFVVAIFFIGYIGKRCGFTYKEIKDGMIGCVAENAEMMVIMLGIGFVIGTWVFAGTVPVMIGWLAELISVKYVLVLSFVFCGIIAMIIGTSSATMGTIGVIMLGVATIQGINPGIAAELLSAAPSSGRFVLCWQIWLTTMPPSQAIHRLRQSSFVCRQKRLVQSYLLHFSSLSGCG